MSEIIKNIGWWGVPPTGDSIASFEGTICWPKRRLGKLHTKTPKVGDTIVDRQKDKNIGFTVVSIDDGNGSIQDDYYMKVKCDGYTYEED